MNIGIGHSHLRLSNLAPNNSFQKQKSDKSESTLLESKLAALTVQRTSAFSRWVCHNERPYAYLTISFIYPFIEQKLSAFNFLLFSPKILVWLLLHFIMYLIKDRRLVSSSSKYFFSYTLFFYIRMLSFKPRLNILIFLPILG